MAPFSEPELGALLAGLAAELVPPRRARVAIVPRGDGRYDVAVAAFDYFAELSLLCGLLTVHGLDIESGDVHTLPAEALPGPSPAHGGGRRAGGTARKIVDVFRVRPREESVPDGQRLERELHELLDLVAEGRGLDARERLNVRLVDSLPESGTDEAAQAPVEIRFDHSADPSWTTLDVRGPDAPGFLYALANALALRGVYIHSVHIESTAGEARDRFLVGRRETGKALDPVEEEGLRRAVTLIRQFTARLPQAPDPARALRYFDQFLDRVSELPEDVLGTFSSPAALGDLARFLGSSAYLWEDVLRQRIEHFLPVVAGARRRPLQDRATLVADLRSRLDEHAHQRWPDVLQEWRDEHTLLVETKRLLDPSLTLEAFSLALTDLGEALVTAAVGAIRARLEREHGPPREPDGRECRLAVMALGKFGGREMGYASDLELIFFYSGSGRTDVTGREAGAFFDELVRLLLDVLRAPEEGLFRLDLRLRPHGGKGPLATPLAAARAYYRPGGEAAPFERQALIKLRAVAGDPELGDEVGRLRDAFVWSGEPWDREAALRLRERQVHELVPTGRFNVKLSRGGLVDAEYAVQYLQVQHGRDRPELRIPSTLLALDRLQASGLVDPDEHHDLRAGYLFFREVADALRMVRGQAGDLLLPEDGSDDYGFLARRLGYSGGRGAAAAALRADVVRHRERLTALYDRRLRSG